MSNTRRLKSGSYNCRVFSHYEYTKAPDGSIKKRAIYESFTSKSKRECERMASEWAYLRNLRPEDMTVHEAVTRYIAAKDGTLSESTIAGYMKYLNAHFTDIASFTLRDLTSEILQLWISKLAVTLSAKYVCNIWGLFSAAARMFAPDTRYHVSLPQKKPYKAYTPNDGDIEALIETAKQDQELLHYVLFVICGLRRSEACAVEYSDIGTNSVAVSKARIKDKNHCWIIKDLPKTSDSCRTVPMPEGFTQLFPAGSGRVIQSDPDIITRKFRKAVKAAGLEAFTPHRCRHYFASICHALGIPDQYIMAYGGWKTDHVMKTIYREELSDVSRREAKVLIGHFDRFEKQAKHGTEYGTKAHKA